MANTKISALPANNNPTGSEELVYALNNANGKMTLNTMKTFSNSGQQAELVSGVNIKTINGDSILGSGNLVVGGGGGGGGFEPTELGGDANIWELSEGAYITTYNLYYVSGQAVPIMGATGATHKQMLFVTEESTGEKGYFVFNINHRNTNYLSRAAYGYSISSSVGECNRLGAWDAVITGITSNGTGGIDLISGSTFTQVITDFETTSALSGSLRVSSLYSGMTYNIYVSSYVPAGTATITLGTGVTNPLNITLPSATNKPFVITLLATSSSTAIVTSCTIQA